MIGSLVRAFASIVVACSFASEGFGQTYKDRDWNTAFSANCPLPDPSRNSGSVVAVTQDGDRKIAFTLRPGEVGGCSTDNQARNSASYWERAELRQSGTLALGNLYDISFSVQLPEGFTGSREAFFQIHGWANGCPAYPPTMLMFNSSRLELHALSGVKQGANGDGAKGQHKRIAVTASLSGFRDRARQLRLLLDLRTKPGRAELFIDGNRAAGPVSVDFAACATPYVKIGIYRPGPGRSVSRAVFDDLTISRAK